MTDTVVIDLPAEHLAGDVPQLDDTEPTWETGQDADGNWYLCRAAMSTDGESRSGSREGR